MITLNELLKTNVFESCKVVSGANNLDKAISSVSVLETPDFSKYIIEDSLIITTMYPIKEDYDLFVKLLKTLKEKNSSGLVIKIKRYIEEVPNEIVNIANSINFPIITIDYDANLSILFNSIIGELQSREFAKNNFSSLYFDILSDISKQPSTKTLIKSIDKISDLDMCILNTKSNHKYASSDLILEYFDRYQNSQNTLITHGNDIIYFTDIVYDDTLIYKMAMMSHNDKRYVLYNYAEIYKMIAIFIYQKKQENLLKQNQFLMSFISTITSNYNSNQELIEASRFYNWDLKFPLSLFVFTYNCPQEDTSIINSYINSSIQSFFDISYSQFKMIYMKDYLLFILNTTESMTIADNIWELYNIITHKYPNIKLKVAYSNPIEQSQDIPKIFAILSETVHNATQKMIDLNVFNENHVRLISLLKTVNYDKLKDFTLPILDKLIKYEKNNNLPLINTLYKYIQCRFSIKDTSDALYIHANSLKYRLSIIKKLGYDIDNCRNHFFDLYLALYVYINLLPNS